jgi:tetratricopeptide (TPR) repeat protein
MIDTNTHKAAILLIISLVVSTSCEINRPTLPTHANGTLTITPPTPTFSLPTPTSTPPMDNTYLSAARTKFWTEDWIELEKLASELHRSNPSSAEVILMLASAQTGLGKYSEAVDTIEKIDPVKITEKDILLQIFDTDIRLAKKTLDLQLSKAILNHSRVVLKQINKIYPNEISTSISATFIMSEPNYADEISFMMSKPDYANDVSGISPEAVTDFQEGEKNFNTKNFKEAQRYYELALRKDPEFHLASLYLADTYISQGDYKTAISKLESLLGQHPELIQGWEFLGDSYQEMGLWKHAWAAYVTGLMLDQENTKIQDAMARLFGKYELWRGSYLDQYEIPLKLPLDALIEEKPLNNTTEVNIEQGSVVAQSHDPYIEYMVAWSRFPTNLSYDEEKAIPHQILEDMSSGFPNINSLGEPHRFLYSAAYIFFEDYHYQNIADKNNLIGTNISWICGRKLYLVQIKVPYENENAFTLINTTRNVMFENYNCQ